MRQGRRLGVDVGVARVGVATCDPEGVLATPVETVPRGAGQPPTDVVRIAALAAELGVIEVVVGLPKSLSGQEGQAAAAARRYAAALVAPLRPVRVRLLDERLTTVDAHRSLREAGRATRDHRGVIDQQAAVLILQTALDLERSSGQPPGEPLDSRKPRRRGGGAQGNEP